MASRGEKDRQANQRRYMEFNHNWGSDREKSRTVDVDSVRDLLRHGGKSSVQISRILQRPAPAVVDALHGLLEADEVALKDGKWVLR